MRVSAPRANALGIVLLLGGLIGCGGCGANEEPVGAAAPSAEPPSDGTAVLEGRVLLAEGEELGRYPRHPMEVGPARPALPDACAAPRPEDQVPVRRAEGGGLGGVLVALADFSREVEHEPETHRLTIEDCRLTPRLVAATRGDTLVLRNETDYPFMPDLGEGMLRAVLHEEEREIELGQGGVRSLTCGFAAACGRAEVVTLYHPLHAVTDAEGRYRIEGVPAGEEIRLNAWHPVYQETNQTLTLQPGETRSVDLRLAPAPQVAVPEPEASDFEGHPEDDPDVPIF